MVTLLVVLFVVTRRVYPLQQGLRRRIGIKIVFVLRLAEYIHYNKD